MAENDPIKKDGEADQNRRKMSMEAVPVVREKKISKAPVVKRAKLLPKNESKHKHLALYFFLKIETCSWNRLRKCLKTVILIALIKKKND